MNDELDKATLWLLRAEKESSMDKLIDKLFDIMIIWFGVIIMVVGTIAFGLFTLGILDILYACS